MKSQIERILRESLEAAEDTMRWASEAMSRHKPSLLSKGDPDKFARFQRYYDDAEETAAQIRELLNGASEAEREK